MLDGLAAFVEFDACVTTQELIESVNCDGAIYDGGMMGV